MTIERVRVGDIEMAYRFDGASAGPVVMMAHAMGTSHRIWDRQIPALKNYRVLRYDWRGHGDTDAPAGAYTLDQFLKDAVGLMDALGIDKVHWVGISTGGMIGQGLGIEFPERVLSLTLCNTTSFAGDWYRGWVKERQQVVRESGMGPVWDMTKNLWFTDDYVNAAGPDFEATRKVFVKTTVDGYIGGTSAVAELAYRDHLHRISCPTQIIAAGADTVTPVDHSETIRDRIAGSQLHVIDGQRHFSNIELPDEFNAVLLHALTQNGVGPDA